MTIRIKQPMKRGRLIAEATAAPLMFKGQKYFFWKIKLIKDKHGVLRLIAQVTGIHKQYCYYQFLKRAKFEKFVETYFEEVRKYEETRRNKKNNKQL